MKQITILNRKYLINDTWKILMLTNQPVTAFLFLVVIQKLAACSSNLETGELIFILALLPK